MGTRLGRGIACRFLAQASWILAAVFAAAGEVSQTAAKMERFGFATDVDYLDGPEREAIGSGRGTFTTIDTDGNLFIVNQHITAVIRCLRADGRVVTIAGDDRWPGNHKLAEGPAAYLMSRGWPGMAGLYTRLGGVIVAYGLPLNGEERGRLYFYWPGEMPHKIFMRKEDGRWWFRRLGQPGKLKPPTVVGQKVKLDETDLTDARIGNGCVVWGGNVYLLDEARGEMTCVLVLRDYFPKALALYDQWRGGGSGQRPAEIKVPDNIVRADDGAVYVVYYWRGPPHGVFRILPDTIQVEHIVADNSGRMKGLGANRDGRGLMTTWHGGPADVYTSGSVVFLHSIDSQVVRRWLNGRVSTLCHDGEWRETRGRAPGEAAVWAGYYQPSPGGAGYIHITHAGQESGDNRFYKIGPIDFGKPTVGPLQTDIPAVGREDGAPK